MMSTLVQNEAALQTRNEGTSVNVKRQKKNKRLKRSQDSKMPFLMKGKMNGEMCKK